MAADVADWTQAVNVTGGSVAISGTVTVTISGTPTVVISGTPNVNIANVPSVTIASGTINIGNVATMNVQQANGVSVVGPNLLSPRVSGPITAGWHAGVNQNAVVFNNDGTITLTATAAGDCSAVPTNGISGATSAVPVIPGQQYYIEWAVAAITHAGATARIFIRGLDATGAAWDFNAFAAGVPVVLGNWVVFSGIYTVPELPSGGSHAVYFAQPEAWLQGVTNAGDQFLVNHLLFQQIGSFAVTAQQGQLPVALITPNQPPLDVSIQAQANNSAAWMITPAAGVTIDLFEIVTTYVATAGAALYYIGHGTVLPVAVPAAAVCLIVSGNTGAFVYPFHGASLPTGDGIWLWNASGQQLGTWHEINYSLT